MSQSTTRSNAEVFLRSLIAGTRVQYRHRQYQIIQAGDEIVAPSGVYECDHELLVTIATMERGSEKTEVMMPCDLSLNTIFDMCQDMSEEERISIISSTVLASMVPKRDKA